MADPEVMDPNSNVQLIRRDNLSDLAAAADGTAVQYWFSKPAPDRSNRTAYLEYATDIMAFMGNGDDRFSEVLGEKINLVNVFVHKVRIRGDVDTSTGEVNYKSGDRVVLIDDEGHTVVATSDGLIDSLKTLFQLVGHPSHWPELWGGPLPVKLIQVDGRDARRIYKVELWREKAPKGRK